MSEINDAAIEAEILAKKLTAPRITAADISAAITNITYTILPSGKVMVCEITLRNGFTVRGEAATVSKENFDVDIGKKISYENARNKIWELEGYLLQERLFQTQGSTFKSRLIQEQQDLAAKTGKLLAFLDQPAYQALPEEERARLRRQSLIMDEYHDVLTRRINALHTPPENNNEPAK